MLLGRVAVQVLPVPFVTVMPPEQVTVAAPPEGRPVRVSVTVPPPIRDSVEGVRVSVDASLPTVTVQAAVLPPSAVVTVMVALPALTAVTVPLAF